MKARHHSLLKKPKRPAAEADAESRQTCGVNMTWSCCHGSRCCPTCHSQSRVWRLVPEHTTRAVSEPATMRSRVGQRKRPLT